MLAQDYFSWSRQMTGLLNGQRGEWSAKWRMTVYYTHLRAGKGEINELVNLPDVVGMEIAINGEIFSLSREAWQRELNFASGKVL